MPTINDAQDAVNTGAASLGAGVPSINVRHDPPRLSILSNLSGGIGPTRTTRFRPNVSVNADLETKYETVVKGFKVLQITCRDLKVKLANCEEKVRSGEQTYAALEEKVDNREWAYAVLEEKVQSTEASYAEIVSKLTNQIGSYDAAYRQLVSQAEEKSRSDTAAFTEQISKMEERIRFNEASFMALVSQMEGKLQASETACSELAKWMEECEKALKSRESDLTSLHKIIHEYVACGICLGIPVQPCSTECRHIFCAMCLLAWWETDQTTSCPICRKVVEFPPICDPVQGFVAVARTQAGEAEISDSFDADLFDDFFPPTGLDAGRSRRSAIEIS